MNDTPPPPNVDPGALSEIAKGVFVIGDRRVPLVPNIGIVLGHDAALVIDTGMGPANGAKALAVAKDLAGSRPLILTLTHFHPEHGFGAQAFQGRRQDHLQRSAAGRTEPQGRSFSRHVSLVRTGGRSGPRGDDNRRTGRNL
jgi:glyoxylase-like metal-dependent hydrolase (beta-lactamase superfamily II)